MYIADDSASEATLPIPMNYGIIMEFVFKCWKNPEESHGIQQQQGTSMNPKNPEWSLKYPMEFTVTLKYTPKNPKNPEGSLKYPMEFTVT